LAPGRGTQLTLTRLDRFLSGDTSPSAGTRWGLKLLVFGITAALMTLGHVRMASCPDCPVEFRGLDANGPFFMLLLIDGAPGLVYLLGVRRWRTVVSCGAAICLMSAVPWALMLVGVETAVAGVFLGFPVLLILCVTGALADLVAWERATVGNYESRWKA
jgi:hypothetical protein